MAKSANTTPPLNRADRERLRESSRLTGEILGGLERQVRPGIATMAIEEAVRLEIKERGAKPAFLGYRGYPHATCVSVNEVFVHGFPGERVLEEGDIVAVDFGVVVDGLYSDSAYTFAVGEARPSVRRFLDCVQASLYASIAAARPGAQTGDLGAACERVVAGGGYRVSRELFGHGIGRSLHGEPLVPNFGPGGNGAILAAGQPLAIEIMASMGRPETTTLPDKWSLATKDGSWTCHYEHTMLVGDPPEVLTGSPIWAAAEAARAAG